MIADQRSRSRSGNKTDRMAECLRSRTCRQNIFYHRSIYIILVQERINALTIQEVLQRIGIFLLPLLILASPGIIERYVHWHSP